ncbi:MAG: hypothetical protein R2796_09210 [Chitinophagaceae bacterium]|nr:hypothetical protein [Chitinophagaceae bacterium]HQU56006.1 hypothetical protein [Chitinophagaceae bacterium]HQV06292.1 hypothetical protein [Chitinophagaceae bacterium]
MKKRLIERNIVIVLFVMVLITFSLAQEDSKKMEQGITSMAAQPAVRLLAEKQIKILPVKNFSPRHK